MFKALSPACLHMSGVCIDNILVERHPVVLTRCSMKSCNSGCRLNSMQRKHTDLHSCVTSNSCCQAVTACSANSPAVISPAQPSVSPLSAKRSWEQVLASAGSLSNVCARPSHRFRASKSVLTDPHGDQGCCSHCAGQYNRWTGIKFWRCLSKSPELHCDATCREHPHCHNQGHSDVHLREG